MQILIGTSGFPIGKKKYYSEFNFVELDDTFKTFVKSKTLKKFREYSGENFSFALKAPIFLTDAHELFVKFTSNVPQLQQNKLENYGLCKDTPQNKQLLSLFSQEVESIDADSVIFYTSNKVFPTSNNIKSMNTFFSNLKELDAFKERDLFWHFLGFWDEDSVKEVLEGTKVIPAYDPLMDEMQFDTDVNYYTMRGLGRYSRFYPDSALENLAEIIMNKGVDTYVVFKGASQLSDAKRFKALIENW